MNSMYARTGDPETSHEAAALIDEDVPLEGQVFDILNRYGAKIDEDIFNAYDLRAQVDGLRRYTPQRLRTVRAELVKQRRVEWSGEKGRTKGGHPSRMWQVVV